MNSDSWEVAAVPLGEAVEAYEIEVLSAGSVVRLLRAATPLALYASADELTDFGAQQDRIEIRIFQMSEVAGRGYPLTVELTVE
jgi:hypothetical protein